MSSGVGVEGLAMGFHSNCGWNQYLPVPPYPAVNEAPSTIVEPLPPLPDECSLAAMSSRPNGARRLDTRVGMRDRVACAHQRGLSIHVDLQTALE